MTLSWPILIYYPSIYEDKLLKSTKEFDRDKRLVWPNSGVSRIWVAETKTTDGDVLFIPLFTSQSSLTVMCEGTRTGYTVRALVKSVYADCGKRGWIWGGVTCKVYVSVIPPLLSYAATDYHTYNVNSFGHVTTTSRPCIPYLTYFSLTHHCKMAARCPWRQ